MTDIAELKDEEALEALQELHNHRSFVCGRPGCKLALSIGLEVTGRSHLLDALVDSGCEGSCIHKKVVKRLQIPTKKLPCPVPVFNPSEKSMDFPQYIPNLIKDKARDRQI